MAEANKENWFKRTWGKVCKYFRELKSELKKVTWPNKATVLKNTGTVLLCSLLIGACIWIFDGVAYSLVQLILSVFKG